MCEANVSANQIITLSLSHGPIDSEEASRGYRLVESFQG